MKIAAAGIQMSSSHQEQQQREVSERLRHWVGKRPDFEATPGASAQVALSQQAQAMQHASPDKTNASNAVSESTDASNNDPMLVLLRTLLEKMFGIKLKLFDASEMTSNAQTTAEANAELRAAATGTASAGFGIEYDYHETYSETETTKFSAEGIVRTTDGQEIKFNVQLEMSRSYSERLDVSLRAGDAAQKKDPLVVNFDGHSARLSDQRFEIDLDGDGRNEIARFVAQGSGFLAFDKNADGKIDDGKELFGPTTGDGFAELAAHDEDHNGWIDEGDPIYARLRVWSKTANGSDTMQTMKEAGIGAVSLGSVATPFELKDQENTLLGEVRSSGVYLGEDGSAGTVQQIDLAV